MTEFLPSQVEWFESEKAAGRVAVGRTIEEHYQLLAEEEVRQNEAPPLTQEELDRQEQKAAAHAQTEADKAAAEASEEAAEAAAREVSPEEDENQIRHEAVYAAVRKAATELGIPVEYEDEDEICDPIFFLPGGDTMALDVCPVGCLAARLYFKSEGYDLLEPGVGLHIQIVAAMAAEVLSHPDVASLVEPSECPLSPATEELLQTVLLSDVPGSYKQWAMLRLGAAAG